VNEAASLAASQGLTIELGPYLPSEQYPYDTIVVQDPVPGDAIKPGGSVLVQPSSGPAGINLDTLGLAGLPRNQAERKLQDEGLAPQVVEVGSANVPEGMVIGTDPAGEVFPGDTVELQVSVGNKVQIPVDIQSRPVDRAEKQLEALGFRIGKKIGVDRKSIEASGIDLNAAGIEDQDVVGVQGRDNAALGAWMNPGATIDLLYFDRKAGGG
ncbi:MAG: PASTA domain-containing protein, partial [Thermomicrobiales bacterium]